MSDYDALILAIQATAAAWAGWQLRNIVRRYRAKKKAEEFVAAATKAFRDMTK